MSDKQIKVQQITHEVLVVQLCLTLCNPIDYSPSGSSVHAIFQTRILEWVAMPFSKRSSWPRDQTRVSCIVERFFTIWATSVTIYIREKLKHIHTCLIHICIHINRHTSKIIGRCYSIIYYSYNKYIFINHVYNSNSHIKEVIRTSQVVLVVKNPPVSAGVIRDTALIPAWGRSPVGGNGNPLQYLAWRIPWTEEPGGLWSITSQRVGHDWRQHISATPRLVRYA